MKFRAAIGMAIRKRLQLFLGFRAQRWCGSVWLALLVCLPSAAGQGVDGDQFLDGIGETALVARYPLEGELLDRSRNGLHANLRGDGPRFVADARFGRVLSLPGKVGTYLQVPGRALEEVEGLTVMGWVFLRSPRMGQRFLSISSPSGVQLDCALVGDEEGDGLRVGLGPGAPDGVRRAVGRSVPLERWVHLALVVDAVGGVLSVFQDGVRVGQVTHRLARLEALLQAEDARRNEVCFGRSPVETEPGLDANLHDLRIYSVPLTDDQVATVHRNANQNAAGVPPAGRLAGAVGEDRAGSAAPSRAGWELAKVAEVQAQTVVGTLPRLPRWVAGEYLDGRPANDVRVIWPAPTNNLGVREPGTYSITGRVAGTRWEPRAVVTVVPRTSEASSAPARQAEAFGLDEVTLTSDLQGRVTPFQRHRDLFLKGLAGTDPDRFLYVFRDAFGQAQPPGVQPLGGWDSVTTRLRGHATGHYLSAIAQAYAGAGHDPGLRTNFAAKMAHLIETLHDLARRSGRPTNEGGAFTADPLAVPPGPGRTNYDSNLGREGIRTDYWNWGVGFLSAYPPDQFIMLEKGATYGGGNHQIWAPYYTLHKLLAGLLDGYEVGGNRKALEIAEGMGHWVRRRLQALPDSTRIAMWNRYIAGEYGGMNEVLARLARLTADARHLECARLFDNIDFFYGNAAREHGLARNVDTLRGKHANQHIPQITGALEMHRNTGEPTYYDIAENFWHLCLGGYMYSIGGVAGARNPNNAECFTAEPDSLFANGFSRAGQNETCATYNLLKLSRALFEYRTVAEYFDYYERALYNDILASVAADYPGNTYHIPLGPGSRKQFGNAAMDGFSCCNGTALESATKLQNSIYFRSVDRRSLFVNLFIPSRLDWKERSVVVTQRTSFPYEDTTRLSLAGGGTFDVRVRVPRWATRGFEVRINGRPERVQATPGTFAVLSREWRDQDIVEVRMPFGFHLDRVMDRPNLASLFYGPVLLAAEEAGPRADWRPVTLDAADPGRSIEGDPATLRFRTGDTVFRPFFETYGRYSVYLDVTPRGSR